MTDKEKAKIIKLLTKIEPRRPYFDECPDGYQEGNRDWMENNSKILIEVMELIIKDKA